MKIVYPNLVGEIAKRGIDKREIAKYIGISSRSFYDRMVGAVSFTWDEVVAINAGFFPDMQKDYLFAKANQESA